MYIFYQEGVMQVAKWGNSLAVRLPAAVVELLNLKEGDDINVRVDDTGAFAVSRKPSRVELIEQFKRFQGRVPADFKFDREEANER
jgi:antitoxin MazE